MTDTEDAPRRVQLEEDRLADIRDLVHRLGGRPKPEDAPRLLADARTALTDLLADRADLVRANAEAGAELARWCGAI